MWEPNENWKIYLTCFILSAVLGIAWFVIHNPYLFYEGKTIQNKDDVISLVYENRNELERAMKDCSRLEQKRDMLRQIAIIPTPYRGEAGLTDMISVFYDWI